MAEPAVNDLVDQLRRIRYDLTAAQGKLSDALELAARLGPPPSRATCPECGLPMRGTHSLAEHRYLAHNGPEPEHWRNAEAASVEPVEAGS